MLLLVSNQHVALPVGTLLTDRQRVLRGTGAGGQVTPMPMLIGTSGWQYRDWRGGVYPQGPPPRLPLQAPPPPLPHPGKKQNHPPPARPRALAPPPAPP